MFIKSGSVRNKLKPSKQSEAASGAFLNFVFVLRACGLFPFVLNRPFAPQLAVAVESGGRELRDRKEESGPSLSQVAPVRWREDSKRRK